MTDRNCTIQDTPKQVNTRKKRKTRTIEDFVILATAKFGYRFDYSKAVYLTSQHKLEIICNKHGSFWQAPCDHLRKKTKHACLECSNESFRCSYSNFVARANIKHNNFYEYPQSNIEKLHDFTSIVCPIHGVFEQIAYSHLAGFGCNDCANEDNRKDTEAFIREANLTHGLNRYDYSKSCYVKHDINIEIVCPEHGSFFQKPKSHIHGGAGCSVCARQNRGWERSAFKAYCDKNNNGYGFLYVVECRKGVEMFYKVGITSKSISKRFYPCNLPYNYDVKFLITESPDFIYDLEFKLHNVLREYKYTPNERFAGETECFSSISSITKLLKKFSTTKQYQLIT